MTDNNDLFNPALGDDSPTRFDIDPNKNYLEEYVGEGKKFADPMQLARGKAESDAHIARLEAEARARSEDFKALQNELNTRTRLEELMDKITNLTKQSPSNSPQPRADERDDGKSGLNPDEIKKIALNTLSEVSEAEKRKNNAKLVQSKLVEKFGTRYVDILTERTNKLGLPKQEAERLAETAPEAFLEMVGVNRESTSNIFASPNSSINTTSMQNSKEKKTYSYYDEMRKKDPAKFNSPAIQKERRDMAHKMGQEFFDV